MLGGRWYTFEVCLTRDGKLMSVSTPGGKRWVLCRWGSFIAPVLPKRRIGDYNNCTCCVVNATMTRVRAPIIDKAWKLHTH